MRHSRYGLCVAAVSVFAVVLPIRAQQAPPAAPAPPAPQPPAAAPPASPAPPAPQPPAAAPPAASPPAAPPAAPAPGAPAPAAPAPAAPAPGEPAAPPAEGVPASPPPGEASAAPAPSIAPDTATLPPPAETPPETPAAEATPEPEPLPEPETASEPEPPTEEILVTGSRVKRTSFQASAPVQVIDRREIEFSGATNMSDLIQNMTVSQGTGFSGSANAAGTVSVNLRGLGAGATLVLVNGRRVVHSGGGIAFTFTDIGTIPLSVVERVEIFKGGASAIYGSDAVGGVVNIITRKDWDGAKIQLEAQAAEEFDYKEGTGSVAFGSSGERSRVSLAVSYNLRSELRPSDRDFTKGPPSDWRGYRKVSDIKDALMTQNISILGQPGAYGIMAGDLAIPSPDAACGAAGTDTVVDNDSIPGASLCTWDYREFGSLLSALERVSTYGYGEYDLTNHTSLFTELNVSRARDDATSSPSYSIPSFPTVPADHLDNSMGQPLRFYGRPLGSEAGRSYFQAGDDTLRSVLGLKGDLADAAADTALEDWEWETFASFGVSRYYNLIPDTIVSRFQDALDSCDDPADLNGCFNPYHSAVDGTGTPNSQAVIDSVIGKLTNITDQWLQTYNVGVNGPVLELPGGDLGVALGGEIRHEERATELDHDANQFDLGFFVGNTDAAAERDVHAGYLELVFPFYDGVEVQAAGRVENYSDVGTVGNPTLGVALTPGDIVGADNMAAAFRRLTFRGHVATAFKAPAIYQTFPGTATLPLQITYMGVPSFIPAHYHGNPGLKPEETFVVSGGLSWNPVRPLSLEVDYWNYRWKDAIVPESATDVARTGRSAVQDFDPPIVPVEAQGVLLQRVNLTTRNVTQPIVTDGIDAGLMLKFDEEELGADVGTFRAGVTGTYTLRFIVAQDQVAPIELNAGMWEEPAGCDVEGRFPTADLADNSRTERVASGRCDLVGSANGANVAEALPVLRANFPASWTYEGHMVVFVAHFTSGMEDDAHYDPVTGDYNSIDSWTTFDLQYGYTIDDWFGDSLSLRGGVYNLADAAPPFVDGANGYGIPHDPRGRVFYAKLIGEF